VQVLEDTKPRHQPGGERRLAGSVAVDLAEALFEKAPVDRARQLRQRVLQIDELVEPRPE
jgi:hypothetical protein